MIPSHREPTHPGEMLLEEFLRPLNMTQVAAAAKMKIPLNRMNEIIKGKRGITADTAIRLSRLFETSPEFWMNLQSAWDIYQAAKMLHVTVESVSRRASEAETDSAAFEFHTKAWRSELFEGRVEAAPVTERPKNPAAVRECELEMVA